MSREVGPGTGWGRRSAWIAAGMVLGGLVGSGFNVSAAARKQPRSANRSLEMVSFEIRDVSGNPETATEARFKMCVEDGPVVECFTLMVPRDQVNQMGGDTERWASYSVVPTGYPDGLLFSNPPPY